MQQVCPWFADYEILSIEMVGAGDGRYGGSNVLQDQDTLW
jgi:hypothetical protein